VKIWTAIMIATGVALSFVLTCITPFSALAAFAAHTVSRRLAVLALMGALVGNQIAGYAFLGYPHTLITYLWGPMMALACLAALAVAWRIPNVVAAFVAAFVAYEAVVLVFSALTNSLGDFAWPAFLSAVEANVLGFAVLAALRGCLLAVDRYTRARSAHANR
jgi:hypothetical protein